MKDDSKIKILLVDQDEDNRNTLYEVLEADYDVIVATSAGQALDILAKNYLDIELVLLDIEMTGIDGFDFLTLMNNKGWIEVVPVMIISDYNNAYYIRRAYGLGACDYISRPFDSVVVKRRIDNTVSLNVKQKNMAKLLIKKVDEGERNANIVANILGHIAEFGNGQSNDHVLNMVLITKIMMESLNKTSEKYHFSYDDIWLISNAAAIHDLGKVTIPDDIVYKKGKLTGEEFEIMKSHAIAGQYILDEMAEFTDEPFIKVARDVCRWHHEKYDGGGYPDGLKGDDIPIAAQIVCIAELYDVLTNERSYKDALSTDKAIEMICNGECGALNPELVECLKDNVSCINEELKKDPLSRNVRRNVLRTVRDSFGSVDTTFIEAVLDKMKL